MHLCVYYTRINTLSPNNKQTLSTTYKTYGLDRLFIKFMSLLNICIKLETIRTCCVDFTQNFVENELYVINVIITYNWANYKLNNN